MRELKNILTPPRILVSKTFSEIPVLWLQTGLPELKRHFGWKVEHVKDLQPREQQSCWHLSTNAGECESTNPWKWNIVERWHNRFAYSDSKMKITRKSSVMICCPLQSYMLLHKSRNLLSVLGTVCVWTFSCFFCLWSDNKFVIYSICTSVSYSQENTINFSIWKWFGWYI